MRILALGVAAFIATNIDGLFVLMAFFVVSAGATAPVVAGQYAGMLVLILVSLGISLISLVIPVAWIGLMGLLPLAIGLVLLARILRGRRSLWSDASPALVAAQPSNRISSRTLLVASVTVANGGDNIGVYVPLFASSRPHEIVSLVAIFLVMTALWCAAGLYLVSNRVVGAYTRRYGDLILPFVLIVVGIAILIKANTTSLL